MSEQGPGDPRNITPEASPQAAPPPPLHSEQAMTGARAPASDWRPGGRSKRRNIIAIALVLVVAAALAWFLTLQSHKSAGGPGGGPGAGAQGGGGRPGGGGRSSGRRRPSTTVGVATATLGSIPIQLEALGAVTPNATVIVRTQITGTLMQVNFREGQMVKQGQILASVDPRPYQIALQQAQAAMMRDQAALQNARVDLQRYQTLLSQDSIARQQVDTQAALVRQDEGVIALDRAAVAAAQLNVTYTSIRSPVSGRVGLRQVDVGNYVTGNETNGIVVVTQVQPIGVIFSIPEDAAPAIMQRFAQGAALPVTALDRSRSTVIATGTLGSLDNQVDASTGTVRAKAMFANTNGLLLPLQFVNVRVLVNTVTNVVTVPAAAVRHGPQGDYVFVLQSDHTAKVVQVKLGPSLGEVASITTGLQAGAQVITSGGDQLRDGAKVALPGDRPQGGYGRGEGAKKKGGLFGWVSNLFGGGKSANTSGSDAADASGGGGRGGGGQGGAAAGGQAGAYAARAAQRMAQMEQTLALDPAQKAKAEQIFSAARQRAMAQAGDDVSARRQAMQEANAQAFSQLEPMLRKDQIAKLPQAKTELAQRGGGNRARGGGEGGGQ